MNSYRKLHVITAMILNLVLLIITFSSNMPKVLLLVMGVLSIIFYTSGSMKLMLKGLAVFIPISFITFLINLFFINQGGTVLFTVGTRNITLEALMYAVVLSIKLLQVIYIFQCLALMTDSDRAVSFFSSVMPKSTLIFMIALKFFPLMNKRINGLKEIYSIRGVDFENRTINGKIKAYLPVLSVLLEDSLEKSFDIGEAVFVRGFLSTKRSVYERQKLKSYDFSIIFSSLLILMIYFALNVKTVYNVFSIDLLPFMFILFAALYTQLIFIWKRLVIE